MRKIESLRECLSDQAASKKHDQYCSAFFLFMDVSNAAGHRLSTEAIEEIIAAHPNVAECAVIGASDKLKGDVPLALVVLKTGTTRAHQEIAADLIAAV